MLLGTFLQDVFVFGKIMLLPEIYLGEVLLQYPVTSSRAASPILTSASKLSEDDAPQSSNVMALERERHSFRQAHTFTLMLKEDGEKH